MGIHESAGKSDEWYTPKYIFDALGCEFNMDVASPRDISKVHTPASVFIHNDSLNREWDGFVWMNPPFGGRNGIVPWLEKLYQHGNGIALTPDRTSCPWWQQYAKKADAHLQVANKIKFLRPDGSTGNQPSTGTTLFAYGQIAVRALLTAEFNGLGLTFFRKPTLQLTA